MDNQSFAEYVWW